MLWLIENVEGIELSELASLLPQLSAARREQLARYRREALAVQSALAELLLRHALREEYGLNELPTIEAGKMGKPFFPQRPELHFNLSHCKSAVACALDGAPVGVDVQELRPLKAFPMRERRHRASPASPMTDEAIPRARETPAVYRILSETERAWVEAGQTPSEQDSRFTAVWTCKEAWGKERGDGICYDLKATSFLPRPGEWTQYGRRFYHAAAQDYALTLCAAGSMPRSLVSLANITKL